MADMRRGTLVAVIDDGSDEGDRVQHGTVDDLADLLRERDYGDYTVTAVYAVDAGKLVEIQWSVAVGPYSEDDFATARVKVVFPDGHGEIGSYRIDGRS